MLSLFITIIHKSRNRVIRREREKLTELTAPERGAVEEALPERKVELVELWCLECGKV
jgi:hypothetical protein